MIRGIAIGSGGIGMSMKMVGCVLCSKEVTKRSTVELSSLQVTPDVMRILNFPARGRACKEHSRVKSLRELIALHNSQHRARVLCEHGKEIQEGIEAMRRNPHNLGLSRLTRRLR